MKTVISIFLVLAFATVAGQTPQKPDPVDKKDPFNEQPIPYEHIREADVFWQKRIWRVIDVNEKMNLPFKYPKAPLIKIILDAAYDGEVTVYDPADDEFTTPLTLKEVKEIGVTRDTIDVIDPITGDITREPTVDLLNFNNIKKFRIKEDWIFDTETSTMMVRIIGIAPILDKYDANGNYMGELPMFWVYYPNLRSTFAVTETFNPFNDAKRLSLG